MSQRIQVFRQIHFGPPACEDWSVNRKTAIQLQNAAKHFRVGGDTIKAVNDLSFEIKQGEIVALLGPNGPGKTTTLDMVLGFTTPTAGTVTTLGVKPQQAARAGRVSAVLQSGSLLPDLTVGETVRMIGALYSGGLDPKTALARAGISHLAKRKVSRCSGGEVQRLRFALALLPDPEVLILDEPTAGMDVNARQEFWNTMREEARAGRTVVFATHYLHEAEEFAQRIILIAAGQLIADDTVANIRSFAGLKTVSVRWADPDPLLLAKLPAVKSHTATEKKLVFKSDNADALVRFLLTETPASDVEVHTASLDEAFTNLTTKTP